MHLLEHILSIVSPPCMWKHHNIHSLGFHLTFTCFCLRILSLTPNAITLQGSTREWTDNKPVKAGSEGRVGVNSELGLRWIMCFKGLVREVLRELVWDTRETRTPRECPCSKAVVLLSKKATATTAWLDLSTDTSDDQPPFYPPFHLFFTSQPHSSSIKRSCQGLFVQAGRQVRGGRLMWAMLFEDGPESVSWGCMVLGAVFKVLITVMVMCSQEMHKCQHTLTMGS